MSNTSVRIEEGFIITPEYDEIYRKVRRAYAAQDARQVLENKGIELEGEPFEEIVDKYDSWQGDNGYWYEALEGFISEKLDVLVGEKAGSGIRVSGVFQDWDIYDQRFDIGKVEFTVTPDSIAQMTYYDLLALQAQPISDGGDMSLVVSRFLKDAIENNKVVPPAKWGWEDPFEIHANEEDIKFYLDYLYEIA